MKNLILQDESFSKDMKETAVPYLEQRKKEIWLPRGKDRYLHCERYLADEAVGVAVISHGFTETAEKYQEVIYYFLKEHYHVYIPEHCGHGHSYRLVKDLSLVHVDSYWRYVRDLLAVAHLARKEYGELPMFLYAHSMGGGVGAAALAMEPDLFQKAVLTSPMIRPLTAGLPWSVARVAAGVLCRVGKRRNYVPGGHVFDGKEYFEDSASTSRERFDFYQVKRNTNPLYQMCSPSNGWLNEAAKLNRYLHKYGWRRIETPVLIFQAQEDTFVSSRQQNIFAAKIRKAGKTSAKVVYVPGTRHEIYNSPAAVLRKYWRTVFRFLAM